MFKTWLYAEMAKHTEDQLRSMGYEFRVENNLPDKFGVICYFNKTWVGEASFTQSVEKIQQENPYWVDIWDDDQDPLKPNQMWVTNLWVDPSHQRNGIATAMYMIAERESGNKIVRTPSRTSDSDAVWQQPDRKFGADLGS